MNVTSTFGSTFIVNLLVFMSELMICFSLIVFLFVFNFKLTFLLMIIFLLIIFIYYKYISNRLKIAGLRRVESDEKIIDYSKLSFQNMKELKLFNKQDFFIKKFTQSALESEESNFFYQVSAQYPRIGMEIFCNFRNLCFNFSNELFKTLELRNNNNPCVLWSFNIQNFTFSE